MSHHNRSPDPARRAFPAWKVAHCNSGAVAQFPVGAHKLDVAEKRQVLQLLDAFIERGQLKRKQESRT